MARRVKLPESNLRAKRRRRRIFRLTLVVVLVALMVVGIVLSTWLPQIRVQEVQVLGVQSFPVEKVSNFVKKTIAGKYFFSIPKDNIALYPKKDIEAALLNEFPQFKTATVRAENLQTISVTVTERGPVALWCGDTEVAACYLLDAEGRAYAPAANFAGNPYRQYRGALSSSTTPPQFLTSAAFRSLGALVDTLAKVKPNLEIESVRVDPNMDVHATFTNGFVLLFVLGGDSADVYQRFQLALSAEPFTKHTLSDFLYLDLRFGDKLYYKLK